MRSRELGEGLRLLVEKAGLTGKEVAEHLSWSQSDVSRMLTGRKRIEEREVTLLLGLCKARPAVVDRLLKLCEEANRPGWYQQHGSRIPAKLEVFLEHEARATKIQDFSVLAIPGALQVEAYARAVITRAVNVPELEVEERVKVRKTRSAIFSGSNAPKATYFLHESALHVLVGDRGVMSEQLHHLLRMSVRPSLNIRVLSFSAGEHVSMDGQFKLMEFATINPIVYLESATTTAFLEQPEEIKVYREIVEGLAQSALSPEESRELMSTLAVELFGD